MKTFFFTLFSKLLRQIVLLIGRTIYRVNTSGADKIPAEGGALLVANHASYLDFILIVCSIPRPVRFVMNADIFMKPGLKWILQGLQCIPISPRGGKNNFDDFNETVRQQIDQGHVVVIFAEGTVSRTGQILEFKKGVEHISAIINAPIIPVHFHNVQGSPFTFRGGNKKMEKFSPKNLRKYVRVLIGDPLKVPVKAFALRQKIKELEVINFDRHLDSMKSLHQILKDSIQRGNKGSWSDHENTILFNELPDKISQLNKILLPLLGDEQYIAVMLPADPSALLINLWLILNNKTPVNINPSASNESRLYMYNKAKCKSIITTLNLNFTRFAPNADKIIYIEDIEAGIESGIEVKPICKTLENTGNQIFRWFSKNRTGDYPIAIFYEETGRDNIRCIKLSGKNLLAVISSLRQIYYFKKETVMMSNLNLYDAYGFVLELLLPLIHDMHVHLLHTTNEYSAINSELQKHKPELVIASPSLLQQIAETAQLRNIPFLTHMFTADLHPDHQSISALTERNIEVFVCAGMNATSSVFAVNLNNYEGKDIAGKPLEQENNLRNSIGKPLPGIAVKVCNPENEEEELLNDKPGIIMIKGPAVSVSTEGHEYSGNGEWLKTGLRGYITHKGFIVLSE